MAEPEHTEVRLPTIQQLTDLGWQDGQLQWEPEWTVPKNPSERNRRELGQSFQSWRADLVIFDTEETQGQWEHLLAIFEFKKPGTQEARSQLENYLSLETRAKFGYWTNGTKSLALYKLPDGNFLEKKNAPLPRPGDNLSIPSDIPLSYSQLIVPSERQLKGVFERILNVVVAADSRSTRPDDRLNQLCNILLLKLDSDVNASDNTEVPVAFQLAPTAAATAQQVREQFQDLRLLRTDVFSESGDEELVLDDHTIHQAVYELSPFQLMDMSADAVSTAFQVFRKANLKSGEGQYFTPHRVIESAIAIMEITRKDKIIDPACGTGGFLIEAFRSVTAKGKGAKAEANARTWAHKQVFGVDKDNINVKLSRAIMVILGDGSANIHVGDSLREHRWEDDYRHLVPPLKNEQYTVVITNPPFEQNLKLSASDARKNGYTIAAAAKGRPDKYSNLELGLIFLERAYRLLAKGGRLGIVLPESYFFSSSYAWLHGWLEGRLILRGVLNIPMEAFQGFYRAKTNFYIFEKA